MPFPELRRKRPRDKGPEEDKEAELHRKLHHALKELRTVVKKARTFEIQKTLKKLKNARDQDTENAVTRDLIAQVEILKHLNYDQLAHSALLTKLKKDRDLFANPSIQAISVELASSIASPVAPGTPRAKVQSRILSSKVLASEITATIEILRALLHPPVEWESIGIQKGSRASSNISKKRRTGSGDEKQASSSEDDVAGPSGERSDGVSENTSGDEADDGWESGTVGVPSESDASVAGAAGDDNLDSEVSSDAGFPLQVPQGKIRQSHESKGQSEFLPSLSVGFIRGDSGSEFGDSEVGGIKKNRRGQRARRAIWEKKFGKKANHIKKRRHTEHRQPGSASVDRRSGKGNTSRRTPMKSSALSYHREQVPGSKLGKSGGVKYSSSTRRPSDRNGDHREKQGDRPLHPSWEAKKKQKSASIVPSQATKIVFSESA